MISRRHQVDVHVAPGIEKRRQREVAAFKRLRHRIVVEIRCVKDQFALDGGMTSLLGHLRMHSLDDFHDAFFWALLVAIPRYELILRTLEVERNNRDFVAMTFGETLSFIDEVGKASEAHTARLNRIGNAVVECLAGAEEPHHDSPSPTSCASDFIRKPSSAK